MRPRPPAKVARLATEPVARPSIPPTGLPAEAGARVTDTAKAPPANDGRMSLMEHLVELRTRLIRCAIADRHRFGGRLAHLLPGARVLRGPLIELSKDPNIDSQFQSFEPLELFMLRIKVSAYLGIAVAMPFLLWQIWRFISPGSLRERAEVRHGVRGLGHASVHHRRRHRLLDAPGGAGLPAVDGRRAGRDPVHRRELPHA
jgi:hypothetical protein